jgi:hypothetical protein
MGTQIRLLLAGIALGFSNHLSPVEAGSASKLRTACLEKRCGFLDGAGRWAIEPTYRGVDDFSEGRAFVSVVDSEGVDRWGYIDETGKPCGRFEWEYPIGMPVPGEEQGIVFSEGLGLVKKDGQFGFVRRDGVVAIPVQFEDAQRFYEGLAAVKVAGKYGYVDHAGAIVIKPQFESSTSFHEGLAAVEVGGKFGFIEKTGDFVIPPRFDYVDVFSEGLAAVQVGEFPNQQWGFIDEVGNWVVAPQFLRAIRFSGGLAGVELPSEASAETKMGDWGFIDHDGKLLIPAQYKQVSPHSCGLAVVRSEYLAGYIDLRGNWVLPPTFELAGKFDCEWMRVGSFESRPYWTGYIDPTGRFVWRWP